MDNAVVADGILAVILIAGALIGARRGLFKSLMGLVVVIAALVGAVFLADLLTDPVADLVAPKVEDAVVKQFSEALDKVITENSADAYRAVSGLLRKYGVVGGWLNDRLDPLKSAAQDAGASAKERTADAFRSAIAPGVRRTVRSTVHGVLLLVLYPVLLLALKLLTGMLDHVFDLPLLGTVNNLGGAAIGLAEAALLAYVLVYIAAHLGVEAVTEHAEDARLLPFFLNHSPVELISSFSRQG